MVALVAFLQTMKRDAPRIGFVLLFVALAILLSHQLPNMTGMAEWAPLFNTIFMIGILFGVSHLFRRILFHRIDLQKIGLDACANPIGAGIVFFSICMVLCVMITSFVSMLH